MTASIYILFVLALNLLFLLTYKYLSVKLNIFDEPDKKIKIHKKPIPLLGGIFIYCNICLFFVFILIFRENFRPDIFTSNKSLFNFFFFSTALFIIGFLDDKIKISANLKFFSFFVLILIAVLIDKNFILEILNFSFYKKEIFLENFSILFTVFCIVLFINAFNMFDGINCQASLYAIFLILILGINGLDINLLTTFLIPLLVILFLNFQNKIFLGNSGSYLLPFVFSLLYILSYNSKFFKADEILLIFLFPGLDMFRLFITRLSKKNNPFLGDKNHIHHLVLEKTNSNLTTILFTVILPISFYFVYVYSDINNLYFLTGIICYYLVLYLNSKKNK